MHFYCLAVEAGFYSDVVECLPVDPATWVRFPAGAGKIFSLYDMTSFRIVDFKGCQRSKIMSISLFKAGLFPKYKKIVCLLDI